MKSVWNPPWEVDMAQFLEGQAQTPTYSIWICIFNKILTEFAYVLERQKHGSRTMFLKVWSPSTAGALLKSTFTSSVPEVLRLILCG